MICMCQYFLLTTACAGVFFSLVKTTICAIVRLGSEVTHFYIRRIEVNNLNKIYGSN